MGASPKNSRSRPTNKFEDYVLTYEVGPSVGLFPISNTKMSYVENSLPADPYDIAGLEGADDAGGSFDLGFSFPFENTSFHTLFVSSNGSCVLSNSSTSPALNYKTPENNLVPDEFPEQEVWLAPWWDDLRSVWRTPNGTFAGSASSDFDSYLTTAGYTLPDDKNGMIQGIIPWPPGIDPTLGGVKFYRGNSPLGRVVVVRWKFFAYWTSPKNIGTCDAVLYESGRIEFRYAPRLVTQRIIDEKATVGIFCYGGSYGFPRHRDFGGMLKKDESNIRSPYVNGGFVYNGSFVDDGAKYTSTLNTLDHWPGVGQFGAMFRFSPPQNRRKQNRSITSLRDTEPFVNRTGTSYFDDRYAVPLPAAGTKTRIEYPTMLPESTKLGSFWDPFSVTELHRSGSIVVEREGVTHGLYDDVLHDSILDGRRRSGR